MQPTLESVHGHPAPDITAWVKSPSGLVMDIIRPFVPFLSASNLDYADLLQAGYVGMVEAAARFDPDRGIQFDTYATPWIRGEAASALRGATRQSHIPRKRYLLYLRIARCIDQLQGRGEKATPADVAAALQLPVNYVCMAMRALSETCVSYTDEDASAALAQSAEDAFFATYQEPDILQEVPALTEAERAALQCRFRFAPYDDGEDLMTYEQIGHTLGISTTLAHRHVQRGLKKVREALQP